MCWCPICKQHCNSGVLVLESQALECEFWNTEENDCRIRKCLELLQKILEVKV